jgi:hypothetical protein
MFFVKFYKLDFGQTYFLSTFPHFCPTCKVFKQIGMLDIQS